MVSFNNVSVLVTGGAGFIGSRATAKLLASGAKVRVVDDMSKGDAANLKDILPHIEFIQGNLLDVEVARRAMRDIKVCFHFAAKIGGIGFFHKYPASSIRDNTVMNLNLWEVARDHLTRMICISSSMVFERTETFPTPERAIEACPPPLTGYGFSKLIDEYIARTYHEEFGIPYVIVRPFNAYGPGENPGDWVGYAHVIPDLLKKIMDGQCPLEILGDGKQTRSYTYVDDVADAIIFAASHSENDDFNIGTGVETSVLDLCQKMWKLCGKSQPLTCKTLPSLKYDVQKRVPDITKITALGWKPKVGLDEGIARTLEWLKNAK